MQNSINQLANKQYRWLKKMGWTKTNVLEDLALVTSEIGEAVNECRNEKPTQAFGSELADIVLRVMGIAKKNKVDLEHEILTKMRINHARGNYKKRLK